MKPQSSFPHLDNYPYSIGREPMLNDPYQCYIQQQWLEEVQKASATEHPVPEKDTPTKQKDEALISEIHSIISWLSLEDSFEQSLATEIKELLKPKNMKYQKVRDLLNQIKADEEKKTFNILNTYLQDYRGFDSTYQITDYTQVSDELLMRTLRMLEQDSDDHLNMKLVWEVGQSTINLTACWEIQDYPLLKNKSISEECVKNQEAREVWVKGISRYIEWYFEKLIEKEDGKN